MEIGVNGCVFLLLSWAWIKVIRNKIMGLKREVEALMVQPISFSAKHTKITLRSASFKKRDSGFRITSNGSPKLVHQESLNSKHSVSFKHDLNDNKSETTYLKGTAYNAEPELNSLTDLASPGPRSELHAAALKLQKVYKSYRTRRNLADCAVVVEELWWKALDFASLNRSSISFFNDEKPESAVSRWARARTRAAKVGKGLSKNDKAQKLTLRHWLEAIDPRHRYGHNLHLYYDVWFKSESTQPFFYWLDIGDGKEVNIEKCPRIVLQYQCVKYLAPNEREGYEVIVESGKLLYKQSERLVNTIQGSKWIFVLSTSRAMYVGQKKKGRFQHSSFLAGGATTAAGRLVVKEGILKAVWPYSGHYLPTEENFKEFISFLRDNNVDLTDVKTCSIDDDESSSFKNPSNEHAMEAVEVTEEAEGTARIESDESPRASATSVFAMDSTMDDGPTSVEQVACKWRSTGAGRRIGCVRDYPTDLQFKALEQVNLPPTSDPPPIGNKCPIPSPRPGPGLRLSPMLANMSFASPTISLALPKVQKEMISC